MSNLDEIESAVAELPLDELARFREWFARFDAKNWDAQIEQDLAAGRLDELARNAIDDHEAGQTRSL